MFFTPNFELFRNKFLLKHGSAKLLKIEDKVFNSSSLKSLFEKSRSAGLAPTETDFSSSIHTIFFFMTAGAETTAMGVLTAINYWNQSVNLGECICNETDLYRKYLATLKRYSLS